MTIPCPVGPTKSMCTSEIIPCVILLKVRLMLVIAPSIPVTLIVEGYGFALPTAGMLIAFVLANLAVPGGGGLTVRTKLVLAVFVPSLTVTVFVAVPVSPKVGANVRYQW